MIGILGDVDDFEVQHLIWGYAVQGDVCEFGATVCEKNGDALTTPAWDRTARDLAGELVSHAHEPHRRVKDWAALPYMTEHIMRGNVEWPGL